MTNLVDEKDIEAFYEGQTYGEDFIERSIETLSLALKVVRAAQKLRATWIHHDCKNEMLEALAPFSQGEKEPKE